MVKKDNSESIQLSELRQYIRYLQRLLDREGIAYDVMKDKTDSSFHEGEITPEHAKLLFSVFKGRNDVYSKRTKLKNGNFAYFPACENFWRYGVCPRTEHKPVKCVDCQGRRWRPVTQRLLMEHLNGKKEDGTDVVGIYPMLKDESCNFLVFDFDDHTDTHEEDDESANLWREDVDALRNVCKVNDIEPLVERSRSGKGAHLWMIFEEPISAVTARRFVTALLTKGADSINQKDFSSYDRMLPAQDHMPPGGLGNLIALPLQGRALQDGNSAFVDEHWKAYGDQWEVLRTVSKISKEFIEKKTEEWSSQGILGILSDVSCEEDTRMENTPWKQETSMYPEDVDGSVAIIESNGLFIDTSNLKNRIQNRMRRLAAFSNPEYYKKQAMGFSTRGTPRIVYCGYDEGEYICLPRGCKEKLEAGLEISGIGYDIQDLRQYGKHIAVDFKGRLYTEQESAAEKMLEYENGVLGAATAFGKTVVGAYMIAERKVNTLILVHNREIMMNWIEDLDKFLDLKDEPPEYKTPSGRIRKRKSAIGKLYSSHDSVTGIIDVVMISSLGKPGSISSLVKKYGMVIMDECHHAGASIAMSVLQEVSSRYVYGFTATPKREDGQEKKVFFQLGPIRYRYTAKDRARKQGIQHFVYPRFTRLVDINEEKLTINDAYKLAAESQIRNEQILSDVTKCIEAGRSPLILTKFKKHAVYLYEQLQGSADHIVLLHGGRSAKERAAVHEQLNCVKAADTCILVAIGKYIGEGFNFPRLDTMMIAMPIAWEGNVEQYAGRLHRDYEGKKDVVIYDYIDSHIRVLERMYHKRLKAYKRIGYQIGTAESGETKSTNAIFDSDSYLHVYQNDLKESTNEIVIASPVLNRRKVCSFIDHVKDVQEKGVKVTVLTLAVGRYRKNSTSSAERSAGMLREAGIYVKLQDSMHDRFAVIDGKIVWYGSINLLASEKIDDNIMRVSDMEIAQELIERY